MNGQTRIRIGSPKHPTAVYDWLNTCNHIGKNPGTSGYLAVGLAYKISAYEKTKGYI